MIVFPTIKVGLTIHVFIYTYNKSKPKIEMHYANSKQKTLIRRVFFVQNVCKLAKDMADRYTTLNLIGKKKFSVLLLNKSAYYAFHLDLEARYKALC